MVVNREPTCVESLVFVTWLLEWPIAPEKNQFSFSSSRCPFGRMDIALSFFVLSQILGNVGFSQCFTKGFPSVRVVIFLLWYYVVDLIYDVTSSDLSSLVLLSILNNSSTFPVSVFGTLSMTSFSCPLSSFSCVDYY